MVPFRRRDVYRWQMRGFYSVNAVLPVPVQDLSYDGLSGADVNNAQHEGHECCEAIV